MEPCPDCEEFRQLIDPVPRHVHWCHERIAELEAELAREVECYNDLKSEYNKECARAEKAEAEVERLRKLLDWWEQEHGVPGNYPDVVGGREEATP